jgi:galactokinase
MAAAYLNAKLCPPGTELPKDAGPLGVSIHGFHDNYFKNTQKSMTEQLEELIELTKKTLTQEQGYTVEEVASGISISVDDLKARFMSSFPVRGEYFKLRQRALHVFNEALRVLRFLSFLEDPAQAPSSDNTIEFNTRLGKLMNETQDSCRDVYECSCPEIDEICQIAREAGSYGSRLTGAGWGGCSVHLVPADKVDQIKAALVEKYYSKRNIAEEDMEGAIIVSRPMNGSAVFNLDGGKI